jgi:hypothetical protein
VIAVLDACVLYPAALPDLLVWLAVVKAYADGLLRARYRSWPSWGGPMVLPALSSCLPPMTRKGRADLPDGQRRA